MIANFANPGCACTDELTEQQLKAIAPSASSANIAKYLSHFNESFTRFKIETCINRAHFLAQMLHESGSFQYVKELGAGTLDYDPWRGRGLIQITFEENYAAYGTFVGEDVTSSQTAYEKLEDVPHSVLSAAWYWSEYKNIDPSADEDDFMWCTAVVNGAYNGFDDRLSYLNRAIKELGAEECAKKNSDGKYKLEDSKVYGNRKYSFAWGLWNDPDSSKHGVTKSSEQAIKGYERYVSIHSSAGTPDDKGWYGIGKKTKVIDYANRRLEALRGTK